MATVYGSQQEFRAFRKAFRPGHPAGQYRLDIPAGTYQVLILSHFQSRDEQATVDPALQKLLATYFEKPDDLLGRIKYEFGPLKVKGTGIFGISHSDQHVAPGEYDLGAFQ